MAVARPIETVVSPASGGGERQEPRGRAAEAAAAKGKKEEGA